MGYQITLIIVKITKKPSQSEAYYQGPHIVFLVEKLLPLKIASGAGNINVAEPYIGIDLGKVM